MNIVVIAPTPYFSDRGCHIRIYEELMALSRSGHSAELFTYHLGRDEGPFPIQRTPPLKWYTKTSAGPAWGKLYLDVLLLKLLWKQRAHLRTFDVIHAHLHEGAWLGWWAKKFLKLPLVLDAQGSLVGELDQHSFFKIPGVRTIFKWVEGFIVRKSDYIFTSSQASYDMIYEHYPATRFKLALLEDAVSTDMKYVQTTDELDSLRTLMHTSTQAPTVIYTGGLSAIKGIDYFLNSIPDVLTKHPDTTFIIAGFPDVERCQSIVDELGVGGAVRFTMRINYFDLPKYLALADIAVDPKPGGAGEASGKSLNYMAAGLPIVAFDSTNARAMLGEAAHLVAEVSPSALANGINQLLNDYAHNPDHLTAMSDYGIERISKKYTWDKRINIATKVYEQLSQ